jgi:hypothetical protein
METSNNYSGENLRIPEIDNPKQRTLDEVLEEIREIINNTHWVQTRLAKLKASGYPIEECWVKNGSIATIWYMKGKKVLRIQVTESELHGKYHKANCVVIPASDILFQEGDASRVRNFPIKKYPEIDTSIQKSGNITENKKR